MIFNNVENWGFIVISRTEGTYFHFLSKLNLGNDVVTSRKSQHVS